jgi:Uma2 family endonuclease
MSTMPTTGGGAGGGAIAGEILPQTTRVVVHDLTWQTYEAILRDRSGGGPRMAYDRGSLEFMSPSSRHERLNNIIARLVETFSEELGIDIVGTGSTTFKSQLKERGLEPDKSYYIQNEAMVRGKDIDLNLDPPPDLAIEIDLRRSVLDKLSLYAALGISEVWSHDGKKVVVHVLEPSGGFAVKDRSAALPDFPVNDLPRFLARIDSESDTAIVRAFRAWVREKFGRD